MKALEYALKFTSSKTGEEAPSSIKTLESWQSI